MSVQEAIPTFSRAGRNLWYWKLSIWKIIVECFDYVLAGIVMALPSAEWMDQQQSNKWMFRLGIVKLLVIGADKGIDKMIIMLKSDPGITGTSPDTIRFTKSDAQPT